MRPGVALLSLWLCQNVSAPPANNYEIIIFGGTVVDGSGRGGFRADVAIRQGRIAAVGQLDAAHAAVRLNAAGLVVAPGFIDIHTHARHGIFAVPTAENYLRQGVTTVFDGQDGDSPLPLGAFLKQLAGTPIAVNFGMFAGQGSIRAAVLGTENRPATPPELARMEDLVRQAMREGAFGLSTGLFYVPGAYTPTDELVALSRVAGQAGGIYITHMRDEAAGILDSVRETIRIGEEARLPVQVTHHKVVGAASRGLSRETLALAAAARRRGVDVTFDQYPYTASSTSVSVLLPQWALEGGRAELLSRLKDPKQRARLLAETAGRIRTDRAGGDPDRVVFSWCPFDPGLAGVSLGEYSRRRGRPATMEGAAESALEIEQRGGCSAVFHQVTSDEDLERILADPHTMIGSDGEVPAFGVGVPHPRSYGTFAQVLGHYVRERRLLSLEEAVRKMTSLPADRLKLRDRGLLREGRMADVVVFDPARIAARATYLQPHQYAVGVVHLLVNGKVVLRSGSLTEERPGQVLYGSAHLR